MELTIFSRKLTTDSVTEVEDEREKTANT